jgi:hypothetical protein
MRKRLSERDLLRLEAWARKANHHAMISFLEQQPRKIEISRPLLLGSNGLLEILVQGQGLRSSVIREISNLDEPFRSDCVETRTTRMLAQPRNLKPQIHGPIQEQLQKGFRRLCHLDATGCCVGEIVRAHNIQESLLRASSVDGHLLEFNPLGRTDPER